MQWHLSAQKSEKQKEIEALGAMAAIGSIDDVNFLTATFKGADSAYCMLPPFNFFNPEIDLGAHILQTAQLYTSH